jgi:hypothetical protein
MPASFTKWFPSGFRLINGLTLTNWFNNPQSSTEDKITATAGGTQAAAYKLTADISRVSVCTTNGDSVSLPPTSQWVGGKKVVINDGAANLNVYPGNATDQIDTAAVNTAAVITTPKRTIFFCPSIGVISSLEGSRTT